MKPVQVIMELKIGHNRRSFQAILTPQTVRHEETILCTAQFCNKTILIKEQLTNPLKSELLWWKPLSLSMQTVQP